MDLAQELGWAENMQPTPEQLLAYIRRCPEDVALETIATAIRTNNQATHCFVHNHERQLAYWRDRALAAEAATPKRTVD